MEAAATLVAIVVTSAVTSAAPAVQKNASSLVVNHAANAASVARAVATVAPIAAAAIPTATVAVGARPAANAAATHNAFLSLTTDITVPHPSKQ
ncbi:hypothetical protein Ciccas_007866 [Cichlidogyrus casuarinus]|uniref:Secreted protein n=1 Tax=Cichlidogyrus casuarinus TaxID=1844966 RepID=A0ABD2Q1N8_9PLAT